MIMPVFTVHTPPTTAQSVPDPDRFIFVRDGFSFWAFLLGPVWMLWHGLWLALLAYLVLAAIVAAALAWIGASGPVTVGVAVLIALLLGLEASTLRRLALARRRWREAGIVVARNLDLAERRFFQERRAGGSQLPASADADLSTTRVPAPGAAVPPSDVFGLFPQPGGWR
jgi:hypothetical protein